ncbi:hypothetical protein AV530_006139 [Patagioenas fasciata monilis]|uniref:Uncharacterized protein n=1 Tax=Patagioenas fasciata monilis TaxID=372326 RepID=A0A1V4J8B4_PATFA|nr:hypothetical protein AV530_006139 [Patagioenas fasciata monilis]
MVANFQFPFKPCKAATGQREKCKIIGTDGLRLKDVKVFFACNSSFPPRSSQLKPESGTVAFPHPISPQGLPIVTC